MCPVTAGIAVSASIAGVSTAAVVAGTATLTAGAIAGGVIAGAAVGAAIGVGVGGVVNVATGRGFFENAGTSALFGALGGGFSSGVGIIGTGAGAKFASVGVARLAGQLAPYAPSGFSIGLTAAAGSLLAPPQLPTFATPVQTQGVAQLQQFSSQQLRVTGSGGGQAAASLVEAIKRSKARKLTQRDVGDLSIDTASFAGTGLQFA